jgi:hypothetical protein
MTAATLLSRLEKVRQPGADRWSGSCPSHQIRAAIAWLWSDLGQLPDPFCWDFVGIRRAGYRTSQ